MIQNEARMHLRVLMLSDVSGGGCFLVALVAATGLDCDGGLELTAGVFASVLILSLFSMLVDGRRGNCGWHKSPQPRVVSCRIELALRRIVIGLMELQAKRRTNCGSITTRFFWFFVARQEPRAWVQLLPSFVALADPIVSLPSPSSSLPFRRSCTFALRCCTRPLR